MSKVKHTNADAKLITQLLHYQSHPLDFIRNVIGVEPTGQQISLILEMVKPNARVAVKSCTASGKTAVLAWMVVYFLCCYPDCKGIVTAPSSQQLKRVFKSEISKWASKLAYPFNSFIGITSEKIYIEGKKDIQFVSMVTGKAENKESLAGEHAAKVLILVDEASALDPDVFDTLLGTLSYGDTCFVLVSNPVRASGSFFDLFSKSPKGWELLTFKSQDSPNVSPAWIEEIKDVYGEDSDFYRMRVLGEFPILDTAQFIPADLVEAARDRSIGLNSYRQFQRVLGVDPSRFGDDLTVIIDRQGPKIHRVLKFSKLSVPELVKIVIREAQFSNASAIFIDGIGIGSGVVDYVQEYYANYNEGVITDDQRVEVIDVVVSRKASNSRMWANHRAEIWGEMKEWLATADVPAEDDKLRSDFVGINYTYNDKLQIILERKKDMKRRGEESPDTADALALTFSKKVEVSNKRIMIGRKKARAIKPSTYSWD